MTTVAPDYRRILIVATRQIGDVLCTTPLMRRAREFWPNATIDVLGYEKTMGMLAGNSDINEVMESSEHPKWPEYRQLIRRIFRRYDLAIVTQPSDRAHIYGLLAAPKRVGIVPNSRSHNWWKKLFSVHTVELDYWRQHVVLERLRLLEIFAPKPPYNVQGGHAPVVSVIPPTPEPLPEGLLEFLGSDLPVVIHGTPMWRFKRWPVKNWAELIAHLVDTGKKVVLTGSSSQQDKTLNAEILLMLNQTHPETPSSHVRDCAGQLTLTQTTALLKLAQLYVGVDTSITHLAAACGTPSIALFGATAPTNFGPWPQKTAISLNAQSIWSLRGSVAAAGALRIQELGNVTICQGPGECVPCRKAGCDNHFDSRSQCLDELSPNVVIEVFERMRFS